MKHPPPHELPIRVVRQTLGFLAGLWLVHRETALPLPPSKFLTPLGGKEEPSPVYRTTLWIRTTHAATPPSTARPLLATLGPCVTKARFPSLRQCCLCAYCPLLVSRGCCSEPCALGISTVCVLCPLTALLHTDHSLIFSSILLEFGLRVDHNSSACTHLPRTLG